MAKSLTGLIKSPARATAYRASRLFNIYVAPLELSRHPFRFVPFLSSLLICSSSLLFVCDSRSTARTKCNQNNCHQTNLARSAWSLCPICVSCFVPAPPSSLSASDCRHAMSTSPFCTCNRRRQQKFFAQFCETHSTVLFCLNFVSLPLRSPLLQLVCHLLVILCT